MTKAQIKKIMIDYEGRRAHDSIIGRICAIDNTPAGEGKSLRRARRRLNIRQAAWTSTQNTVGVAQRAAYRMPGSMKGK